MYMSQEVAKEHNMREDAQFANMNHKDGRLSENVLC